MPTDVESILPAPEALGRYEILAQLGAGSVCVVYRAFDPVLQRALAVKVLRPEWSRQPDLRAAFLARARAASRLSHPCLAEVYDVGEQDGQAYVAMELLSGSTLAEVLLSGRLVPLRTVLDYGIQLAQALAAVHAAGLVHGTIKPAKLHLVKSGRALKLVDTGFLRPEGAGPVPDTPDCRAPEGHTGSAVDGRADLYCCGIVLRHLLALGPGLDALTTDASLPSASEGAAPLRKRLPSALLEVLARCSQMLPEQRYPSALALAEALRAVQVTLVTEAPVAAVVVPVQRSARARWLACWPFALLALWALSLAGGIVLMQAVQQRALLQQSSARGAAVARLLANQAAENVLGANWDDVQVLVETTMHQQGFHHLQIVDPGGHVRGSSVLMQVGTLYRPPEGNDLKMGEPGVRVMRQQPLEGPPVLEFDTPIQFSGRTVGRLLLGVPQLERNQSSAFGVWSSLCLLLLLSLLAAVPAFVLGQRGLRLTRPSEDS